MEFPAFVWLVVIGTAIWVYFDAKAIGVRKGVITGLGDMGPGGWAVVTLLLWIIGFPMYLAKRGQFKRALQSASFEGGALPPPLPPAFAGDRLATLERLSALRQSGALTDTEFQAEKAKLN